MHRTLVAEPKNGTRLVYLAEGISPKEASRFNHDSDPISKGYRVVFNCQSEKESVTRHEEITVSYQAD